jgi:hypothetical protein
MANLPIGVPRGFTFQKHYMCDVCGEYFPEGRMVSFRGKRYGRPCRCYLDIKSILRDENIEVPRDTGRDDRIIEIG